jgi:RNA polymerase sigma factor (sigma-70 family)
MESTQTLLLRVRKGDSDARERLSARFLPSLQRWAHARLPQGSRDLAETDDLVQIAFLRALPHFDSFDPRHPGAFLGYLHQILINLVREEIRRTRKLPSQVSLPDDLPDDRQEYLERTLGKDSIAAYEAALADLPPVQQQAVVLRLEFGFPHDEIARLLGRRSANAVRMQIARALAVLAEKMDAGR